MKNAKRILALILAVLMLLASSACTGATEPDVTNEESTGVDKETETTFAVTEEETTVTDTEQVVTTEQAVITDSPETTAQEEKLEIYSIGDFQSGLAVICTSTGYGYIDTNGKIVIDPIYEEAYNFDFFDGKYIAVAKKNGKYGYIDNDGNIVIDFQYDSADTEIKRMSRVSLDGTSYYIDITDGTIAYTVTGKEVAIGEYSGGCIWVQTKEELISGTKNYLSYYACNGYLVEKLENAKPCIVYGVDYSKINTWGYAFFYNDRGLCAFSLDYGPFVGVDDANGNGWYDISGFKPFYHEYIMCQTGRNINYYYWDYRKMTLKPSESCNEHDNTSWISLGNDYYYRYRHNWLDATDPYDPVIVYKDEVIIELEKISDFSSANVQGVAHMKYNNKNYFGVHLKSASNIDFFALIDDTGKVVIKPTKDCRFMYSYTETYDYITFTKYEVYSFKSGYCKAQDAATGLWGVIDLSGKWVIKPQYEKISDVYKSGSIVVVANEKQMISVPLGRVLFSATDK